MKNRTFFTLIAVATLTMILSSSAYPRAGGGRSFGSRGSRGFGNSSSYGGSSYGRPSGYNNTFRSQQAPQQPPRPLYTPPPPTGGGFFRSLAGGMAGGFLGSMLFRSLGWGGYGGAPGGMFGGGFGLLEILLLGGLVFLLFRFLISRAATQNQTRYTQQQDDYSQPQYEPTPVHQFDSSVAHAPPPSSLLSTDQAMDIFFQVQGAIANRDLSSARTVLSHDAAVFLETQVENLKKARLINRLDNIAVRNTEVVESWAEDRTDYATIRFTANLLDYTINEDTQAIVEGSKTSPVKFEEYWTFAKDPSAGTWKLSAIEQA